MTHSFVAAVAIVLGAVWLGLAGAGAYPTDHMEATCDMCPAVFVTADEIRAYIEKALDGTGGIDQQVRSIDAGRSNVQIAVVHRGPLAAPGNVAEHSLVTEVYYVISGSGRHRTGPDLVEAQPRSPENYAVRMLNGPGHNAEDIRDAEEQELTAGDVLIIPAGTGHQFVRIDDHITYLMVRVDPDKVVPLMDEAASREYLAGGPRPGGD